MTYETTIPGEHFFPFVKSVTDFVGDAKVIFDDYVLISSLDTAGVLLVDSAVRNPCPPPAPIEVILDLRSIVGITSAKNDVTITIKGDGMVGIKTGRMEYTLPTIIDPTLKNRKMPEKTFPVRLVFKTEAFIEGVKGMLASNKAIEESQGFWFIAEDESTFYFQDKLKMYSKAIFDGESEYTVDLFESPAASMFSIDYMEDIVKHIKAFDDVKLCLAEGQPMIMICVDENRKLAYALANRFPGN